MPREVAIIQGHPDPGGGHLCHALADAYAAGAIAAGHAISRIDIALVDVPFVRSQKEFENGHMPESLVPARDAIVAADHIVMVFPLWLGTMPALVKAFLEQVMRPGTAFEYREKRLPKQLLGGRSAHLFVTMGMPAMAYRWYYMAHGIRGLDRNILKFVGIKPVRETYFGTVETAGDARRQTWLSEMRKYGTTLH